MAIVKPLETGIDGRRRLQLLSPATLEPIGTIDCMTPEDVRRLVAKACQAQPAWAALTFEQRGAYMLKALEILLERQDDFISVIEREGPKPRLDIVQMDIFPVCDALGFYAKNAATYLQTQKVELHGVLAMAKDLYVMARNRRAARRRRRRQRGQGARRWPPQPGPQRPVLRAHGPGECESRHAGDDRGDLRTDHAHHARQGRGRGHPVCQRQRLRFVVERVDRKHRQGPRAGTAGELGKLQHQWNANLWFPPLRTLPWAEED